MSSSSDSESNQPHAVHGHITGGRRTFKLVSVTYPNGITTTINNGLYIGYSPKQAASKAFTKIFQKSQSSASTDGFTVNQTVIFTLQEKTMGSHKKMYVYSGIRKKLNHPQTVTMSGGNKTITYMYSNSIKKISESTPSKSTSVASVGNNVSTFTPNPITGNHGETFSVMDLL
jgi:hypothetical protein